MHRRYNAIEFRDFRRLLDVCGVVCISNSDT